MKQIDKHRDDAFVVHFKRHHIARAKSCTPPSGWLVVVPVFCSDLQLQLQLQQKETNISEQQQRVQVHQKRRHTSLAQRKLMTELRKDAAEHHSSSTQSLAAAAAANDESDKEEEYYSSDEDKSTGLLGNSPG